MTAIHCQTKRVVISDYQSIVLENMEHNLRVNVQENRLKAGTVSVCRIDWEEEESYPQGEFDLVTCADCLYDPVVIPHLVRLGKITVPEF